MRLIWSLGAPDPEGVNWSLYAVPRGQEWVPVIANRGSASIRADLRALSPYLPRSLREKWAANIREVLDLHLSTSTGKDADHTAVLRGVALDAVLILEEANAKKGAA